MRNVITLTRTIFEPQEMVVPWFGTQFTLINTLRVKEEGVK